MRFHCYAANCLFSRENTFGDWPINIAFSPVIQWDSMKYSQNSRRMWRTLMPSTNDQQTVLLYSSVAINIGHLMVTISSTVVHAPYPIMVSMKMLRRSMQRWCGVRMASLTYLLAKNLFDTTRWQNASTTIIIRPISATNGEEFRTTLMQRHQLSMVKSIFDYEILQICWKFWINSFFFVSVGKTYFFKGNLYWLYNNYWIRPERGYPRRASTIWLGCPLQLRQRNNRRRAWVQNINVSIIKWKIQIKDGWIYF